MKAFSNKAERNIIAYILEKNERRGIMKFGKGYWKSFEQGKEREWLVTNGIGGYAGSTIIGANTRRQHGLLTASLHAPVQRTLILSKLEETVEIGEKKYFLGANERVSSKEEGQHHLQRFIYNNLPLYKYQVQDVWIDKKVAMLYGKNTVVIGYSVLNGGQSMKLTVKPLVNFRNHGEESTKESLQFEESVDQQMIRLVPLQNKEVHIKIYSEKGKINKLEKNYDEHVWYAKDVEDGKAGEDTHYIPCEFQIEFAPYERADFSIICTLDELPKEKGWELIADAEKRIDELVQTADLKDDLADTLVKAADQFIVYRKSTDMKTILAGYPWFADWGRDTMIALQGLTLPTKRFKDAKEILWTFSKYVKNGLVPNMFPDEGAEPLYNTVDASLWYFHSVHEYLRYTGKEEDYDFIQKEIYPTLKEIYKAYREGTDFSIYMEEDGLIHAGSGLDQVTWMDVRIGDLVVTPRHGKPVEINALWYNALKVMEKLSQRFGEDSTSYSKLAEKVLESFNEQFWNEERQCLYDTVSNAEKNAQIRPNQIWAVSLPYTMLPREKEKKVVETVIKELYGSYGLRSLSQEDEEYKGIYIGDILDRDCAYHQGTVWSFPLGALITAYCKVNDYSRESIQHARRMLEPIEDHLRDGCVGSIAEIFDGNEPIISRGCYAQAWGVGEILRAYVEDILNYERE